MTIRVDLGNVAIVQTRGEYGYFLESFWTVWLIVTESFFHYKFFEPNILTGNHKQEANVFDGKCNKLLNLNLSLFVPTIIKLKVFLTHVKKIEIL